MINYIITEGQLNKLILEKVKPIKKGIALHITDDKGEYYESKLMEFNNEEEYIEWKESLNEGTEIIGEMDIEEEPQTLKEEVESDVKKKGFDILTKMMNRHYPFITRVYPKTLEKLGTYLGVNIDIDLNKFYKVTGTNPPEQYYNNPHLFELLKEPGMYLRRYVDEKYKEEYSTDYNWDMNDILNKYHQLLPESMRITKFEGRTDEDLRQLDSRDRTFFFRWRDDKEPIDLDVAYFFPTVDIDKL